MTEKFWNKEIETAPRDQIEKLQVQGLKKVIQWALDTPFYGKKLKKSEINSPDDFNCIADLTKLPFTTKDDLRNNFPRGLLAVDMSEVVRIHSSSGTTGIPTVIYFTQDDVNRWSDIVARSIIATGARKGDIFQNMMTYGLFTGGLGLHYGAEKVGMTVIPVSSGNTKRQVQIMKDFQSTVVHATPSYLMHLHSVIEQSGPGLAGLALRKTFVGAEPHSENTRLKIEEMFGIDAYNSYGLSELNGPGVAFECEFKDSMHVWEDAYIVEIIDPATGQQLPAGEEGEVVLTNLIRQATPLIRYRTRDLAYLTNEPCRCGRTHQRLSRITGRTDDMLIINGVNVFPSQIEEIIMQIPEVGTNWQICLDKDGALDKLTVNVEIYSKMFSGDASQIEKLRSRIKEELRASIVINPIVRLHEPGFLPVSEGKAKRVIDNRPKI